MVFKIIAVPSEIPVKAVEGYIHVDKHLVVIILDLRDPSLSFLSLISLCLLSICNVLDTLYDVPKDK